MIDRLSECRRLNDFSGFLNHIEIDESAWGRKFTFTNEKGKKINYTANQIIKQFELCVRDSIGNKTFVDNMVVKILSLTKNPSNSKILRVMGNFWYKLTHFGFDKYVILSKISSYSIKGRQDLTSDNINDKDANGVTPLNLVLLQKPKSNKAELYVNVKEMLENGANPLQLDSDSRSCIILAFDELKNGNDQPLRVLFELLKKPFFEALLPHMEYNNNLDEDIKSLFAVTLHKHFRSCLPLLSHLSSENQRDLLLNYAAYINENLHKNLSIDYKLQVQEENLKTYINVLLTEHEIKYYNLDSSS